MRKVLQKPDFLGRIVNWVVELQQFDVKFHPHIKGQALADFLVEFCNIPESEELPQESTWVVHVDGSKKWSGSYNDKPRRPRILICHQVRFCHHQQRSRICGSNSWLGYIPRDGRYECRNPE